MTKEEFKTKHCPKCDSKNLGYEFDIFKKPTDKNYYNGNVQCFDCKNKFNKSGLIIKHWILKSKQTERVDEE